MPKKKSRHSNPKPLPPDDPIYTGGFVVFTPASARLPLKPKTSETPSEDESQPEKGEK
jgi:hypothetical protein